MQFSIDEEDEEPRAGRHDTNRRCDEGVEEGEDDVRLGMESTDCRVYKTRIICFGASKRPGHGAQYSDESHQLKYLLVPSIIHYE